MCVAHWEAFKVQAAQEGAAAEAVAAGTKGAAAAEASDLSAIKLAARVRAVACVAQIAEHCPSLADASFYVIVHGFLRACAAQLSGEVSSTQVQAKPPPWAITTALLL